MSTLKFWNKNNDSNETKTDAKNAKNGRNWLHAPDALVNGHVAYLVKFLGTTPVDQPKGIEVVKEAIRRLQFTQQIKKAEGGNSIKMKKVEITISVDGVAVQVRFMQFISCDGFIITLSFRSQKRTTSCTSFHSIKSVTVRMRKAWKSSSVSSRRREHPFKRWPTATPPASTHRPRLLLEAWLEQRRNLTTATSSSRINSLQTSHWLLDRHSIWLIAGTWLIVESNLKSQSSSRTTRSWREPFKHTGIVCATSPKSSRNQTWTSFCCDLAFGTSAKCKFQKLASSTATKLQIWVRWVTHCRSLPYLNISRFRNWRFDTDKRRSNVNRNIAEEHFCADRSSA